MEYAAQRWQHPMKLTWSAKNWNEEKRREKHGENSAASVGNKPLALT